MEVPGSLCMACGESGLTRMIMTKIPFFREVIVSSFECDSCGWANNEVRCDWISLLSLHEPPCKQMQVRP